MQVTFSSLAHGLVRVAAVEQEGEDVADGKGRKEEISGNTIHLSLYEFGVII